MTPPEISARLRSGVFAAPAVVLAVMWLLVAPAPAAAADGPGAPSPGERVLAPVARAGAGPGGDADMGISALLVPLAVVVVVGGLAIYAYTRRRRRAETRTTPGSSGQQQGWPGGEVPPSPLPLLDVETRRLLVETDDAVLTSEEELGIAADRFGKDAVRPFTEALTRARYELTAAFRIRQRLDERLPENDAARRRLLEEIVELCTGAGRRLDGESEAFDRLRALQRTAPQALTAALAAYRQAEGRTGAARSALAALRERWADSATAAIAGNIERAEDRLVFAAGSLDLAEQAVIAAENGRAAVFVRAAEGAVGQAATLIGAVGRIGREITDADSRLDGALTEAGTDLAEARRLLGSGSAEVPASGLAELTARTESVVADVLRERQDGRYDPVDALRRTIRAEAALDEALAGADRKEAGSRRAAELLGPATLAARSTAGAAADYLTTHRGGVGSRARTRLAEAQRRLEESRSLAARDDTRGALREAQQADTLAGDAQRLADDDVRAYLNRHATRGGHQNTDRHTAGFGKPDGSPVGGHETGMDGALLGGIILGGLPGGRAGSGAGYGGGSGPGTFGGSGTRGRLGGDSRF
ncbi:TPM domain-containing protein [Streptomyces sp. NBC_00344]|uniref:TPM domain-containing protein n=1 Tax=Streptomyces sp. NBC_00344 TaxID=2975720 RepID=UPI002E21E7AC